MLPIIKKECMLFEMQVDSKDAAIRNMVVAFEKEGYLCDSELFYEDVLKREEVFSTYIGNNIGIPHGKSAGVQAAGLCIARLAKGVFWNEKETDEVNLIIMIAVSNHNENNLHLKILSRLSRLLMHEDFRNKMKFGSKEEVYRELVGKLED